jgi:hypothetical protein
MVVTELLQRADLSRCVAILETMGEDASIAWAAGLFEGEGTIVDSTGSVQLRIKMTDLDVLEKLLDVSGVGEIYEPYESGSRDGHLRKPHWIWICAEPFVRKVCEAMPPWLGQRRIARAREMGLLG